MARLERTAQCATAHAALPSRSGAGIAGTCCRRRTTCLTSTAVGTHVTLRSGASGKRWQSPGSPSSGLAHCSIFAWSMLLTEVRLEATDLAENATFWPISSALLACQRFSESVHARDMDLMLNENFGATKLGDMALRRRQAGGPREEKFNEDRNLVSRNPVGAGLRSSRGQRAGTTNPWVSQPEVDGEPMCI